MSPPAKKLLTEYLARIISKLAVLQVPSADYDNIIYGRSYQGTDIATLALVADGIEN